ncbi:verprolin like protein [Tanacetum coccineum]
MNYPNSSVLDTSLVNGTLESLKLDHGFKPVSVLGFTRFGYKFSYISKEVKNGGFTSYDSVENRTLSLPNGICSVMTWGLRFELDYSEYDCTNVSCSFGTMGDEIFPRLMSIKVLDCLEDGKVRYILQFTNSSYVRGWSVNPYTSLVAEGVWDEKKKRLMLVACKLLDTRGVRGCSIRLALSVPSRLSLKRRSSIVGKMWSTETRELGNVSFNSPANLNSRISRIKGTTYEYLEHEKVGNLCEKILNTKLKKGTYRDEIFTNLRFDMLLKNKQGQMAYGYASPLYIGDKFYNPYIKSGQWNSSNGYINISYVISFTTRGEFEFGGKVPASKMVEISAEGVYNTKNGVICMIGCRHMPYEKFQRTRSLDCELVINIKYPPLHGQDGEMVHGTIKSTRKKPDPLYFEPIEFSSSSITTLQARESIWRMDLEITMVLVSNTLACIFIGLQLFHVKRNPEIVPFISIVMLVVLTLGYMIPLLLNFEAIFMANRKQNVFLGTDQWLEVNEVLVRVITMVAFLLQFRLLQLTWSSRKGHESQTNLWISDKKVLCLSVPLYIAFGLTAWIAHSLQNSHTKTQQFHSRVLVSQNVTFWSELKSYVGLVLDAYLIPQIMFNLFCDTNGPILTPLYYVGSTMVRLLPHAYDLYRTHSSSWVYDKIYANPGMDYYSTMWDVVVCLGGLICVAVIYVQQRFGGRSVMPKRYRDSVLYQKVPVVIIPEQQIF